MYCCIAVLLINNTAIQQFNNKKKQMKEINKNQTIRIALPVANGKLCAHFGHCNSFALMDVDKQDKTIKHSILIPTPGHQPGVLPQWLYQQGANVIISSGMGSRAKDLFERHGISVVMGAQEDTPERIVQLYLEDSLIAGENICDHDENTHGHSDHKCRQ